LQSLAKDKEPAVALAALTRLSELDTRHVLPVLAAVMASEGAEVREHGVAAMIRNPSDDHVRSLARALSDPHPDVRAHARRGLRQLAAERRELVIAEASRVLGAFEWRGQEQAAILLAQLDHKPASERLVALLTSNRGEVVVAVAWGLRQLAVSETLPAVLKHVQRRHEELLTAGPRLVGGIPAEALDLQLSQLVQFLGQARHKPADAALRALVPRFLRGGMPPVFSPVGHETRAAAVWALGLLHEGNPEEKLVGVIETRLTGDGAMGRDDPRVRRMAAVSLGRMKAKQSLEALRDYSGGAKPTLDVVTNACRWAVGHLTGEPVPPPGIYEVLQREWFLSPLK
jgi:HEAT repeat protein